MKVVTGTKTLGGREVQVELEDSDGERIFKDSWPELSVDQRFKKLAAYADVLVLQYLHRDDHITTEEFNVRLQVLAKELK